MTDRFHDEHQLHERCNKQIEVDERITLDEQIRYELERNKTTVTDGAKSVTPPSESGSRSQREAPHIIHKELSYAIGGAVIEVHRHLGPGQVEVNYERALARELFARGIPFERQVAVDSFYKGERVGEFFVDMIVDNRVILELKSVVQIHQVHRAQLLGYLRATGLKLGLLINFNEAVVWKGIHRIVR